MVPLGTLLIVGVTALIPALRAGRMPTVRALVVGRAPKAGGGQTAQRLASRLPLPRAMSLGLAQPFARPARAVLVGAAVLFGVVSVTFAVGLETGFNKYLDTSTSGFNVASEIVEPTADVGVPWGLYGPNDPRNPHLDAAKVAAALAEIPGTKTAFGWGDSGATMVGAPPGGEPAKVFTTTGDFSWTNMELLSGRWYSAPGEAVVGDKLATAVGIHVGDDVTVVQQNKQLPLKVVGINFDTNVGDYTVMTDAATFTAAGLTPHIDQFNVELASNVSGSDWSTSAAAALTPLNASVQPNSDAGKNIVVITMGALVATLTLMMIAVAALGVLSMVVQDTRERAHDLGIFKALGMTPKQTIAMVLTSVTLTGLIAGLIGVPARGRGGEGDAEPDGERDRPAPAAERDPHLHRRAAHPPAGRRDRDRPARGTAAGRLGGPVADRHRAADRVGPSRAAGRRSKSGAGQYPVVSHSSRPVDAVVGSACDHASMTRRRAPPPRERSLPQRRSGCGRRSADARGAQPRPTAHGVHEQEAGENDAGDGVPTDAGRMTGQPVP